MSANESTVTLTVEALSPEVNDFCHVHTATAETYEQAVTKAALALFADIDATYGAAPMPELWEGVAELLRGDETEFSHFDFSTPEEAFKLTVRDVAPEGVSL